jgi:hypothetical protein
VLAACVLHGTSCVAEGLEATRSPQRNGDGSERCDSCKFYISGILISFSGIKMSKIKVGCVNGGGGGLANPAVLRLRLGLGLAQLKYFDRPRTHFHHLINSSHEGHGQ